MEMIENKVVGKGIGREKSSQSTEYYPTGIKLT